jgi:hypothetical protein
MKDVSEVDNADECWIDSKVLLMQAVFLMSERTGYPTIYLKYSCLVGI